MAGVLSALQQLAEQLQTAPPDPLLGPATLSVGRIEGGLSANTVPDHCRVEIDRRLVRGEDPRSAREQLLTFLRGAQQVRCPFELTDMLSAPALGPELSAELVARLGRAIDAVAGAHRVMAVPYGTDASTIAEAGIPAVVFGPGDIARAHTCDEWVPLDEVEQASEILYRLICDN
jgi:acetylornithine deacetylase